MPRISRPSPALVIALIALFVSLGGVGYAVSVPKNSVGTAQIKNSAVTGPKIASKAVQVNDLGDSVVGTRALAAKGVTNSKLGTNSVTSSKLASKAVQVNDLGDSVVGTRALATKSVNPSKLNVPITTVVRYSEVVAGGQSAYRDVRATCPSNHRIVSGGGGWVSPSSDAPVETMSALAGSRPYPPNATGDQQNAWEVWGRDQSTGARRLMVIARCIAKS